MDSQRDLHIRLKEIRIQKGYTQREIADKLNVSRQAVSRWENGKACPDIDNLSLLGKIYEVSVDELLGKEKVSEEEDKKEGGFSLEEACIIVVLTVSLLLHPVLYIVMLFCVLIWTIKRKKYNKNVAIIIIVSMLINIHN